jgi:hypothetical protein
MRTPGSIGLAACPAAGFAASLVSDMRNAAPFGRSGQSLTPDIGARRRARHGPARLPRPKNKRRSRLLPSQNYGEML